MGSTHTLGVSLVSAAVGGMCSTWVKFSDVVAGGDSGVTLYMVITVAAGLVGEGESSPKQMCWESTIVWVETRESAFIG